MISIFKTFSYIQQNLVIWHIILMIKLLLKYQTIITSTNPIIPSYCDDILCSNGTIILNINGIILCVINKIISTVYASIICSIYGTILSGIDRINSNANGTFICNVYGIILTATDKTIICNVSGIILSAIDKTIEWSYKKVVAGFREIIEQQVCYMIVFYEYKLLYLISIVPYM